MLILFTPCCSVEGEVESVWSGDAGLGVRNVRDENTAITHKDETKDESE